MDEMVVESLTGIGRVVHERGVDLGVFRYSLTIAQRMHQGSIPGLKRVEGFISAPDDNDFALYALVGEPLVLHLEDGRTFNFFVSSAPDGDIANRGGGTLTD